MKKYITPRALLGFALFLFFTAITLFVRADLLDNWDFDMTVKLQDRIPIRFDEFFSFLSVAGRFEYTFGILLTLCILLFFTRKHLASIAMFGLFGIAHVIELIGKTILHQPGPPNMFLRSQFSDFPGLYVHTFSSYPSGHSLRIVFLAIVISFLVHSSKKIPTLAKYSSHAFLAVITLAMLVSRVSLGEHWTTDVIGGSLLGASFALFSLVFL